MARIITVYNNIGGVAKTTTLFNLAVKLSRMNNKVLIVDCDPKCSITSLFFSSNPGVFNSTELPGTSIYQAIKPRFDGEQKIIDVNSINMVKSNLYPKLYLFRGDIDLSYAEGFFARAWISFDKANIYEKNNYMVMNYLLRDLAKKDNYDFILCDVGACPSYTTRLIFLMCDEYFIPLIPDWFSTQSVKLLSITISRWIKRHREFARDLDTDYPEGFKNFPRLRGVILQRILPTKRAIDKEWTEKIGNAIRDNLLYSIPISRNLNRKEPFIVEIPQMGPIPFIAQVNGDAIFDISEKEFINVEEKYEGGHFVSGDWKYWEPRIKIYDKIMENMAEALL